jgi:FkbM family methyltransferase
MHYKTIREIVRHPLNSKNKVRTLIRYLAWNIGRRLMDEANYSIELIPGSCIVLSNRENYATLAYNSGLYDFEDMLFMMHMLKPGDCFGDFGANVGVYSVLAGSRGANVLAVEPVPSTYRRLCANLRMNAISSKPVNCGLSDQKGKLKFTTDRGGMNKVSYQDDNDTCEVDVLTVDELVKQTNLAPIIAKIDVEGFEHPLLTGATELLSTELQAIIIEMNESGREFGYSDEMVHEFIVSHGFSPYQYTPKTRKLVKCNEINRRSLNSLYLKNSVVKMIRERVANASPVDLRGQSI